MNGRDDATTFLQFDSRIGGQSRDSLPTVGQYLTRDQARHVYKKIETGEVINVDAVKHEIEQEKQLSRIDDDSGEVNPYRELVVNNAEKIETQKTQMEQWSILSNSLSYVNTLPGTTSIGIPIAKSTPVTQTGPIPSMYVPTPHV